MKITVFNGSPKASKSNTEIITSAFLKGARTAGAKTETIYLIQQDIKHCTGCFSCWFKTPGICIHKDDMNKLLPLYLESDYVVFATPVYLWNMTACLKNFADRLIQTKSMAVETRENHYDMADAPSCLPKSIVIANAGFPGSNNFDTMRQVMKTSEPVLEIYRNCGMLLQSKVPEVQEKVATWLTIVEQAGKELVSAGAVSPATLEKLDMPLMEDAAYIQYIMGGK